MTVPTIFAEESESILIAPVLRNGGAQHVRRTATIPAVTVVTTIIGMIPFQKGARVNYGGTQVLVADLDTATNVVLDVGFIYTDDTTFTNDPNAFIAGSAVAQAGGIDLFDATAGFTFVAEAEGFITITTSGGSTTTEGDITIDAIISYDA